MLTPAELASGLRAMRDAFTDSMNKLIDAAAAGTPVQPPALPIPPVVVAPALGVVNPLGFLVGGRDTMGFHVDPVVATGTPTTVTIPETGHVISVARPDTGEKFMGYCIRICDQAHGNMGVVGSIGIKGDSIFAKFGGFKADGSNWPVSADHFYNARAWMTPAEQAAADASIGGTWISTPTPAPDPVDIPIEGQ